MPAVAHRQLGAIAVAEVGPRRAHRRDGDPQRAFDDRLLGRPLRLDRDVLPLAAAAAAEQRARRRHALGARALDRRQLAPGHPPLLALDPHAHALAGRGQRDEGGAAVAGALGAGGIALAADGVAPHGQPVDLDGDLAPVAVGHVGYGNGCAARPRARSKSK